jgi:flagellin
VGLGIDALEDIITDPAAANANALLNVDSIDAAIELVSAQRTSLGANQNRLEHTINNLSTTKENLSEANSRITDVDMAEEMTSFTKSNILAQAATSMLAQANQMPQSVLSLLQ